MQIQLRLHHPVAAPQFSQGEAWQSRAQKGKLLARFNVFLPQNVITQGIDQDLLLVGQGLFWNGFDTARRMCNFIVTRQGLRIIHRLAKQRGFICRQRRLGCHIRAFSLVHFLPTQVLLTSMNNPYTVILS